MKAKMMLQVPIMVTLILSALTSSTEGASCGQHGMSMYNDQFTRMVAHFRVFYSPRIVYPGRSNQNEFVWTYRGAPGILRIIIINFSQAPRYWNDADLQKAANEIAACNDSDLTKGGWKRYNDIEYNIDPQYPI